MRKLLGFAVLLLACAALAATAAQAGKTKQNVTNLTFATYVWQPTTVAAMKSIVDSWNKANPSIQVSIVPVDVNSVHDKLLTTFVGNTASDIIHDEAADIPGFTQQGYLANLTPLIPKELKAEIPKSVWDSVDYGHKIAGVPIMLQTYNVFANMDLLKAAGRQGADREAPWTWDRFRAVAKQLTTNGNYGVCWGLRSPTALIQTISLNWGGQWNYLQKRQVGAQRRPGREDDADDDPRHDLQRQVGRPGRRRPLRLGRAARVLRRQVRDDRAGQLPGAGHDRAEPEGLQLGDVPAAQGRDAGSGGEPADALDLRSRARTRPRRCSSSPTS